MGIGGRNVASALFCEHVILYRKEEAEGREHLISYFPAPLPPLTGASAVQIIVAGTQLQMRNEGTLTQRLFCHGKAAQLECIEVMRFIYRAA